MHCYIYCCQAVRISHFAGPLPFDLEAGLVDDTGFSLAFDDGFCLVLLEAVASKIAARLRQ